MAGVIKKEYKKVLQRYYSRKVVEHNLSFSQEWKLLEFNLIKDIKKSSWPSLSRKANILLKLLQTEICQLSLSGSDEIAMGLIDIYSMNIIIRYIAINKVARQSSSAPGIDNVIFKNNCDKIALLLQSKETKLNSLSTMKVKFVKIPKSDGSQKTLGISTMLDRTLQTQLCLLLDPFCEAKYPEHMYGFRKGRNAHQAVGFLKAVLESSDTKHAGLLLLDLKKCSGSLAHRAILEHFAVPFKWRPFLIQWLKAKTVDENGAVFSSINRGIVQGFVIGPLICNVIITKALFGTVTKSSKSLLFKNFNATKSMYDEFTGKKFQRNIDRNVIVYVDDIVIATTNSDEISEIFALVSNLFQKFGLEISKEKSKIINYSEGERIKFKYLGFYFLYVSTKHMYKGGILTQYGDITERKFSKTQNGTYLIYPSSEKFNDIKRKCKSCINLLLKTSLVEVLNKINPIIRGFANYYAWSNSYNRLKTLDGLLFRYFKKYLIRKFRKRGVRRPIWIAKNFLVCKTALDPAGKFTSPYNLKWHPHIELLQNKDNRKRFKNVLFLIFPSKVNKILPIKSAMLPPKLRIQPFYLNEEEFAKYSANLYSKRIHTDNYKKKLFIQQKGICLHCNLFLINNEKGNFFLDIFDSDLEIHYKNEIVTMQKVSKSAHKTANLSNNLVLLHKACHIEITLKSDSGKPSAERSAR